MWSRDEVKQNHAGRDENSILRTHLAPLSSLSSIATGPQIQRFQFFIIVFKTITIIIISTTPYFHHVFRTIAITTISTRTIFRRIIMSQQQLLLISVEQSILFIEVWSRISWLSFVCPYFNCSLYFSWSPNFNLFKLSFHCVQSFSIKFFHMRESERGL